MPLKLLSFSTFPTMFPEAFCNRIVYTWDYLVKDLNCLICLLPKTLGTFYQNHPVLMMKIVMEDHSFKRGCFPIEIQYLTTTVLLNTTKTPYTPQRHTKMHKDTTKTHKDAQGQTKTPERRKNM